MEYPGGGAVLGGGNVPAFLTKLWTLVEDPDTDPLICWSPVHMLACASRELTELFSQFRRSEVIEAEQSRPVSSFSFSGGNFFQMT